MTVEAKRKARVRRSRVPLGDVRRGVGGEVEMIEFIPYRENPLAPLCIVSKVAGLYRLNNGLIKVTFAIDLPVAAGGTDTVAAGHLLWTSEQDWLHSHEVFKFATSEFQRGILRDDGGGRRPIRQ